MAYERNAMMTREDRRPATGLLLDGRYRLAARIGSGGTGDVYRARDLRLGRQVAVKLIPEAPGATSRRFEGEARMLAGFVHPNLVRVLDAGEHEGQWFLVMELIDGESLASRLIRGPLSSEETARLGTSLASALAYVHERGVVHRDVKPANILLGNEGWVWLADFGIARLVDGVGTTAAGTVPGTLAYLAPEQAEGQLVEPAADIYALGLVLLECLTGERAFAGTASEITAARLTRGPAVPHDLDSGWASVIRTMTARAPGNRPSAPAVAGFLATMRTGGRLGAGRGASSAPPSSAPPPPLRSAPSAPSAPPLRPSPPSGSIKPGRAPPAPGPAACGSLQQPCRRRRPAWRGRGGWRSYLPARLRLRKERQQWQVRLRLRQRLTSRRWRVIRSYAGGRLGGPSASHPRSASHARSRSAGQPRDGEGEGPAPSQAPSAPPGAIR